MSTPKLNVVSGCPRSGTSLMMNCIRTAIGEENILGHSLIEPEREPPKLSEAQTYLLAKQKAKRPNRKDARRKMNPDGFWEMKWSVAGIQYDPITAHILNASDGKTVKIVSSGLVRTDPIYINSVIYMARDPRAVAKSQEKLTRDAIIEKFGVVHTPEMFISSSVKAARYFVNNPSVPVAVINYDEFVDGHINPALINTYGQKFAIAAKSIIKPSLRRSEPEDIDSDLWVIADTIFKLLVKSDWRGILEYNANRKPVPSEINFFCPRRNIQTNGKTCEMCMKGRDVLINNYRTQANKKGADWANEPCLWEVEFNPNADDMSIAESIKNNHWKDSKWLDIRKKHKIGDKVASVTSALGIKPCGGCKKRQAYLNGEDPSLNK